MNFSVLGILWGMACGVGVIFIRRAVHRPALTHALARYSSTAPVVIISNSKRVVDYIERRFVVCAIDLAMCDRRSAEITTQRMLFASGGAIIPLMMLVTTSAGGAALPGPLMLLLALGLACGGFQLPIVLLRSHAVVARRQFRTSLSAYLDLVSIMLAGGAGIETALVAASRVGDGATFEIIANALDVARTTRRSPWDVLGEIGTRIGIDELPELAATVRLGGEHGARMTASLVAKAVSMREKQLAEVEALANSATERMGLPMVMLFMGFLVLLGYPAMQMITNGFS